MFHPRKNFGHERPLNPFNIHDSSIKTSVTSLVKIKKSLIKTLSPWAVRQCTNATQFELYRNKQKILLVYLYCLFFVFFCILFLPNKMKKEQKGMEVLQMYWTPSNRIYSSVRYRSSLCWSIKEVYINASFWCQLGY